MAGGDLASLIQQQQEKGELIDEAVVMEIFAQVVSGLHFVHEKNVLHRDLKTVSEKGLCVLTPEQANILLTSDGVVKLADFGVAKVGARGSGATGDGADTGLGN